jgi:hypothetical protein|tara:strand:+ start:852 stop:1112 length:261 start_codon:yes stop_codon:yes gene_type:complete
MFINGSIERRFKMSRDMLVFDSSAKAPIEIFTIDDMDEPTKKHYYKMMTRLLNQTFKVDGVKVLYHESDIDKLKIKISVEGLYEEL